MVYGPSTPYGTTRTRNVRPLNSVSCLPRPSCGTAGKALSLAEQVSLHQSKAGGTQYFPDAAFCFWSDDDNDAANRPNGAAALTPGAPNDNCLTPVELT